MALVYICRLHVERDRRGRRGREGEGEWCGVRVDRGELNGRVSCLGPRTRTGQTKTINGTDGSVPQLKSHPGRNAERYNNHTFVFF